MLLWTRKNEGNNLEAGEIKYTNSTFKIIFYDTNTFCTQYWNV